MKINHFSGAEEFINQKVKKKKIDFGAIFLAPFFAAKITKRT
jgi:hypothetical protein